MVYWVIKNPVNIEVFYSGPLSLIYYWKLPYIPSAFFSYKAI